MCRFLSWGVGSGVRGRECPRTGRGAHPVLARESLGQFWAEVEFIGHMREEIVVEKPGGDISNFAVLGLAGLLRGSG